MNYKPRLDGLRCVAIMMVIIGHFLYFLTGTNGGIFGVNLFFVLSGFLITSILLSDISVTFGKAYKKFIIRRALRIFPVYYLIILFFLAISAQGIKEDWPYLLTYTYNFHVSGLTDWEHHLYSPYWSLSVEEQFYLFFPFVVLLLKRSPKSLVAILLFFLLMAISERIFHFTGLHHYVSLIPNMYALTTGAIAACCVKFQKINAKFFNSIELEIGSFLLFCIIFWQGENLVGYIFYPLFNVYWVIKGAVFSFQLKLVDKFLLSNWAIYIGKISYGIYLYHIMVKHFLEEYLFNPMWNIIPFEKLGFLSKLKYNQAAFEFPFLVLATIIVAAVSFRLIEQPLLKIKDRYLS